VIYGIDPGTEQSALVSLVDVGGGPSVLKAETLPNEELLGRLRMYAARAPYLPDDVVVIEQIESMGMAVGREVFETVFWTGRFYEVVYPARVVRLPRRAVKLHLCGSMQAKDANIRQALIDRYGGSKEAAVGVKAKPGPLYGVKGHEYAALAVAVTWYDQHR
jgi:hypothetical protein